MISLIAASQLTPADSAMHKLSASGALAALAVAIAIGLYVKSIIDRRWRT